MGGVPTTSFVLKSKELEEVLLETTLVVVGRAEAPRLLKDLVIFAIVRLLAVELFDIFYECICFVSACTFKKLKKNENVTMIVMRIFLNGDFLL